MKELKLTTQAIKKLLNENDLVSKKGTRTVDTVVKGNVCLKKEITANGVDVKIFTRDANKQITSIMVWDYTRKGEYIDGIVEVLTNAGYKVDYKQGNPKCVVEL